MIRNADTSILAISAARKILVENAVPKLGYDEGTELSLELSALPVFIMRVAEAANGSWSAADRLGWRFLALVEDDDHSVTIHIRRSRWRKPKATGYTLGKRSQAYLDAMNAALAWADGQGTGSYWPRLLRIPGMQFEAVWLKPVGKKVRDMFFPLDRGRWNGGLLTDSELSEAAQADVARFEKSREARPTD